MNEINKIGLDAAFQAFLAQDVYMHSEATSFVFVRNFKVNLTDAFTAGESPYRVTY
ncbi:MAG TPA: hypothetical protein VL921_01260 [Candidatus Udaeobacter sp.]|jgi:hypothetical protein|nr:hypothetical protein [Candidatus Udaeobacter sp.]